MAFITRLTRLFRADLHAVLDRLETPDLLLAQSIREMEQALDQSRRRCARLRQEVARLAECETRLRALVEESEAALDDCLAAGQDALARAAIRRRLDAERQAAAIQRRAAGLGAELAGLEERIGTQTSRLEELRARAAIFAETADEDETAMPDPAFDSGPVIRESDVEIALLQAKRRREGLA